MTLPARTLDLGKTKSAVDPDASIPSIPMLGDTAGSGADPDTVAVFRESAERPGGTPGPPGGDHRLKRRNSL